MAKGPEALFQSKVRSYLQTLTKSFHTKVAQTSIRGDPDIIGVLNGWSLWIELKASKSSKLTGLQALKLSRIRSAGGIALVVYPENWDEVRELLKELSKCLPTPTPPKKLASLLTTIGSAPLYSKTR